MNWTVAAAVATVLSAGAAVVAVLHAARTFRRSAELEAFLNLTDRYQRIMDDVPPRWRVRDDWDEDVDRDMSVRLRYLNLCSEEFYLRDRRLLSKNVWGVWEAQMQETFASAPYIRAWRTLAPQFNSYPDFKSFVERAQRNHRP